MRLATRMIKRGLPCLQLFGERTNDVRLSDRHADIYDSYADMFTVLVVRTQTSVLCIAHCSEHSRSCVLACPGIGNFVHC